MNDIKDEDEKMDEGKEEESKEEVKVLLNSFIYSYLRITDKSISY